MATSRNSSIAPALARRCTLIAGTTDLNGLPLTAAQELFWHLVDLLVGAQVHPWLAVCVRARLAGMSRAQPGGVVHGEGQDFGDGGGEIDAEPTSARRKVTVVQRPRHRLSERIPMAVVDDLDRATDSTGDWVAEQTRTYLASAGTEGHESNGVRMLR